MLISLSVLMTFAHPDAKYEPKNVDVWKCVLNVKKIEITKFLLVFNVIAIWLEKLLNLMAEMIDFHPKYVRIS